MPTRPQSARAQHYHRPPSARARHYQPVTLVSPWAVDPVEPKGYLVDQRKLDELASWLAETGVLLMLEDMLQRVLLEQPASLLAFLIELSQRHASAARAAQLMQQLAEGKMLSADELSLLRQVQEEPASRPKAKRPASAAAYLEEQGAHELLNRLTKEMLQARPAAPHAFCTVWLQAERDKASPPVEAQEEPGEPEEEAGEEEDRDLVSSEEDGLVLPMASAPRDEPSAPRPREGLLLELTTKLACGQMLEPDEIDQLRRLSLEEQVASGQMLTKDELHELRRYALAEKVARGQMLEAAELELLRRVSLEEQLAAGKMLSEDEMEALRQYALADEAAAAASGGEDAEAAGAASAHEDTPSPQEAAAAVAVQAAARGKQVREEKRLASEFEADMQRVREERQAATAVQAASRGKQARSSKR